MAMPEKPVILSITTTVPTREQGLALARTILAARLAACVQVGEQPITSIYRWQGLLCESSEHRVTIKTLPACEAALQALVAAQHPYEVPQWLACPMQASAAYGAWVQAETAA